MNPEKLEGSTEENQTTEWDNLKFAGEQKSANEENMTETPEGDKGQEKELSENEQVEVDYFKDWYANAKQEHPDASEADFRKTIVSGLGYHLGIPGYRLGDQDNPDAKPTEEQQARLEELYGMVVSKENLAQNIFNKIKNNSKVKKVFAAVALGVSLTAGIMSGTNKSEVAEQQQSAFEFVDDSSSIEEDEAQRAARIFDETMAHNPVLRNEMQKRIDEVELEAQKRIDEAELREQKAIIEYFVETTPYLKETGSEHNLYNIRIQKFYDGDAEPWEVDSLIDDIRRITELRRKHPEFFDASGRLIKSDKPTTKDLDANHSHSISISENNPAVHLYPPGLEEPTITPPQNPQSPGPEEPDHPIKHGEDYSSYR